MFLQLRGAKGKMPKKKLTKKTGTKTDSNMTQVKFPRNSKKVFKIKTQDVGELKSLVIEVITVT